jgi:Ulp1 family protease
MKLDCVDVATLEDYGWINDFVIMAYLSLLNKGRLE